MSRVAILLLIVAATCSAGCRSSSNFGMPRLFGQGSARMQQNQAQQFDPYPDTNVGPAVVGGRPESYSAPAPEPERGTTKNRWSLSSWFGK